MHRWLPLANAIPVALGLALFFSVRRLRTTIGGFAIGTIGLLLQLAVSLDVATPFGAWPTPPLAPRQRGALRLVRARFARGREAPRLMVVR